MLKREGPGWLIARDPSREKYPVMIGGNDWAFELTQNEWESLIPLLFDLEKQVALLGNQLMPEEAITLELERTPWWACLDGEIDCWSLQLILKSGQCDSRGIEAFWPVPAAQSISTAMRIIWDSSQ